MLRVGAASVRLLLANNRTLSQGLGTTALCQFVWPGRAVQDGLPRSTNVRAASMYQASEVEQLLRAIMGIRAHPRLTSGKTSKGHFGTQSLGCAGQTVRPSFHSISQTSAGKLLILKLVGLCFPSLMSDGDDSRLIGATAHENRPGDAGELVGECDRQHVAVEPP